MLQKIFLILSSYFVISCAGPPLPNHPRVSGLYPPKILLKSSLNQYVRLSATPPYYLIADVSDPVQADTFYFCDLGRNMVALKAKELYVSIFLPSNNQAILRQVHIDSWEKLTLEKQEQFVSFKAHNDMYLQPSDKNILTASSKTRIDSCLFQIIEL